MDAKYELLSVILSVVAIVVSIATAICLFVQSKAQHRENARNHKREQDLVHRIHTQEHALQTFIHEREHKLGARSINLASLASLDMELGKPDNDFLKFHKIGKDELESGGITKGELAYLIASFHLGSIYYSTVEEHAENTPFKENDAYRFHMFRSPSTRRAWPLVEMFLNDSTYKERCRNTCKRFFDANLGV